MLGQSYLSLDAAAIRCWMRLFVDTITEQEDNPATLASLKVLWLPPATLRSHGSTISVGSYRFQTG